MSANLLAQHVALIRDYLTTAVAPAPPSPAPAPSPRPPPTTPPVFAVLAVSPIDLTIATLISPARSLATITTTEAAVSVLASLTIPGCTVNLVGAPVSSVTLTGTPTTAGLYRLILTYLRADGSSIVLGSSTHEITVIDPAVLFVAGLNGNYSGRAGVPVSITLCSPTIARNVDVLAFPNITVPGCVTALAWTPGATSAGAFTLVGTPTTAGSYTMTVSYYAGTRLLGTSVHAITITSASTPPPAPPPPAPAPPPPVPAPVPSPPPAPAPGPIPGSDPFYASVIALHDFDLASRLLVLERRERLGVTGPGALQLTIANETGENIVEVLDILFGDLESRGSYPWRGYTTRYLNVFTTDGSFDFVLGSYVEYTANQVIGYAADVGPNLVGGPPSAPGAAGEAAGFDGGPGLQAVVGTAFDASAGDQTIECYARINDATGLWAAGAGNRYTPLVTCLNPGNELVWTLGLLSTLTGPLRTTQLMLWRATRNNPGALGPNAPIVCFSPVASISSALGQFVHVAGQWDSPSGIHGCWWLGSGGSTAETLATPGTGLALRTGAVIRVGGSCPPPALNTIVGSLTVLPLHGAVDELRITAASRNTFASGLTVAISAASRNIPWPNY